MSNLGMGVMINMLSDNKDSVETFKMAVGKKITSLSLSDDAPKNGYTQNALHFVFDDGYKMRLFDNGQSCCEHRYMHTDDDLSYFIGSTLMSVEVRDAPNMPDEYGEHEVQFLVVTTSKGMFTLETHNEHNGYYGGFWVIAHKE